MTSKEKKEWLWNRIIETAEITPSTLISIDLCNTIDIEANCGISDDASIIFSLKEQVSILRKFEEENLIVFLSFENNHKTALFFLKDRSILSNFEEEVKNKVEEKNLIVVETIGGTLFLNKDSGLISLGKISYRLNITSKEFDILYKLVTSKDCRVGYGELLNGVVNKPNKRTLTFKIRNLKRYLEILSNKKIKNKDIFRNIKNFGYELKLRVD